VFDTDQHFNLTQDVPAGGTTTLQVAVTALSSDTVVSVSQAGEELIILRSAWT